MRRIISSTASVVSGSGGLASIVIPGQTGLHVSSPTPEAWAAALRMILSDRTVAEDMGAAARARAVAHFSMEAFIGRCLDLYADMIQQRR